MYQAILENLEGELWELVDQMNEKPLSESVGRTSKFLHYADRTVEVPLNQFKTEKPKMPTIAEQLKAARAKLAEARDGATNAIAQSDDASRVVLGEVNKVLKEAEDLRAEVAELTNGGPEL